MNVSSVRHTYSFLPTQLERQIHLQNEMREKMLAMQIARSREMLYWFGTFYVIAGVGMIAG